MGFNDRIDYELEAYNEYLESLLDKLDDPARGITKYVISNGEDALTENQMFVFKQKVKDEFMIDECPICADSVAWEEMSFTMEEGMCPHCYHQFNKDE